MEFSQHCSFTERHSEHEDCGPGWTVLHSNFSRSHSHLPPDLQRNRIHVQQADSYAIFSTFGINANGGQEFQLAGIYEEFSHADSWCILYAPYFSRTLRETV